MSGIEFNKSFAVNNEQNFKRDLTGETFQQNEVEIGDLLRAFPKGEINISDDILEKFMPAKKEPTPVQKEARNQLNGKVSSTGISYGDADKKINEIRDKYNDDKYFKEVEVQREQPKNIDIYYPPVKQRVFDESKLPEPARTEYREALEAQKEIENNNRALCQKAGISVTQTILTVSSEGDVKSKKIMEMFKKAGLTPQKSEPTEKEKAAREKLDNKQSSTGQTYKDAKAKLDELEAKYADDEKYMSEFESQQPENIAIYIPPYKAFDPYKLEGEDRKAYFEALASVQEIEQENSALVAQAGLGLTPTPKQPRGLYDGIRLY